MSLTLVQIPYSHNCVKVRAALRLKGLAFEVLNVHPMDRSRVRELSGQSLVPVLLDDGRSLTDSTRILLYLEERFPRPALLPADPLPRAECLVLEDWADGAFMELTRRLAYWRLLAAPGALEALWMPKARGPPRWLAGRVARLALRRRFGLSASRNLADEAEARRLAALAVGRLHGRTYLVGERATIADVALAAMVAPLWAAGREIVAEPNVRALLDWSADILGEDETALYRPSGARPDASARAHGAW